MKGIGKKLWIEWEGTNKLGINWQGTKKRTYGRNWEDWAETVRWMGRNRNIPIVFSINSYPFSSHNSSNFTLIVSSYSIPSSFLFYSQFIFCIFTWPWRKDWSLVLNDKHQIRRCLYHKIYLTGFTVSRVQMRIKTIE